MEKYDGADIRRAGLNLGDHKRRLVAEGVVTVCTVTGGGHGRGLIMCITVSLVFMYILHCVHEPEPHAVPHRL